MGMIHKINLMGVPLQVEDLIFNIDRKKQRKRGCFTCGKKGHFRDSCPNMTNPPKGGAKARRLQVSKLGMILQAKMNLQECAAIDPHSSRSSHKCLMASGKISISSSSDDSSSDD
jgi:hypothetical protein